VPAAGDTPTATAASSAVTPVAISRQNSRSTSRRSTGAPGDFIADLPVNALIHSAGLPIATSTIEVLLRPVESTQFTSWTFTERARRAGLLPSLGSVGDPFDNAMAEAFWARMQTELLNRQRWRTRLELANAIFEYIEGFYNRRRRHSALDWMSPVEFETITHPSSLNSSPASP
jgi:transposase InsO family protein